MCVAVAARAYNLLEFGHECRIDQLSKWEIYLNAMFLSCNGPCLPCSHAGGASFSNIYTDLFKYKEVMIMKPGA